MKNIIKKIFNKNSPPIFIAEISANHNGSFENAKKLIFEAKKNGADIVKLQTYEAKNMTINISKKDFIIKSGLWKNYKLWDLYKKAQTPLAWQKKLFDYAKKINIPCFSTAYDDEGVELLQKIKSPIYKISSFELNDVSLVEKICKTKKPIILSTGLADIKDIEKIYKILKKNKCKNFVLLYCISSYPAKINEFNLYNIKILKNKFKCEVGFSDHSMDNSVAMLAVSMGARIIEKHIALSNQKTGPDIAFSIKGKEIKKFKEDLIKAWKLIRVRKFIRDKNQLINKKFQRSIYTIKSLKKGQKFTKLNIKRIRPGYGLPVDKWKYILGKKSNKNFTIGSRINLNDIEK